VFAFECDDGATSSCAVDAIAVGHHQGDAHKDYDATVEAFESGWSGMGGTAFLAQNAPATVDVPCGDAQLGLIVLEISERAWQLGWSLSAILPSRRARSHRLRDGIGRLHAARFNASTTTPISCAGFSYGNQTAF